MKIRQFLKYLSLVSVSFLASAIFNASSTKSVFAEGGNVISLQTNEEVEQGYSYYSYVSIGSLENIATLNVSVHFDESVLTINDAYNQIPCNLYDYSLQEGELLFTYIFGGSSTELKSLFYFYYTIKSDAPIGKTLFDITVNEAFDSNFSEVSVSGSRTNVTVKERHVNKTCNVYGTSYISSKIGNEFDLSYSFSTSNIASGAIRIIYDQELFEFVSLTNGNFLNNKIVDKNSSIKGVVYISFLGTEYNSSRDILTIKFKTIGNKTINSQISAEVYDLYNLELEKIECNSYSTNVSLTYDSAFDTSLPSISLSSNLDTSANKLKITVNLSENSHLGAGDFEIQFNKNIFTYISSTKKFEPSFFNVNDKLVGEGIIKFSIISLTDIVNSQTVLEILFGVSTPHSETNCEFSISGSALADSLTNLIFLNFNGCNQAIAGACTYGEWTVAKDPTCTEPGVEHRFCTECGDEQTRDIPATGHTLTETIVPPTCTEQGYTLHSCKNCDYSYKDNYTDLADHEYNDPISNNDGTHKYECKFCDDFYNEKCTFTSLVTKNPTCTENGVTTYTCSVCGYSYTESIPATGHSYSDSVVKPTCTQQGYTLHECKNCDYSYKDNYTDPTGHHYGKALSNNNGTHTFKCNDCDHSYNENCTYTDSITKEPTCTEQGVRTYTCTVCGYSYTEPIAAKGHSLKETVIAPTCTEQGYTLHECEDCDYSFKDNYVNPTGHHYGKALSNNNGTHTFECNDCDHSYNENCSFTSSITKKPTCTEQGIKTYTCSVCGYSYTESIAATGHSLKDTVIAPTCTEQGYTLHECEDCDYSFKDNYTNATGHHYGDAINNHDGTHTFRCEEGDHSYNENCSFTNTVTKEPTCTEQGTRTYTCTVCGYSYTEKIPATGHSMKETVISPTNEEQGYTLHECENCDYSYKDSYTDPLGHQYGDPINNHDGTHSFKCLTCDKSYSEDCSYTSVVSKEATCTETGIRTYTCAICGYSYTESIPATGHSLKEKVIAPTCTEQGYTLHECEDCDYSYKDSYVDPKGHNYGSAINNHDGTHSYNCKDCDHSYSEDCNFTSTITKEPTCTEEGIKTYTCTECGYSYKESISPTGHNLSETVVPPTCTEQGYTLHECNDCDYSYKDSYTNPTGHHYGEPINNHDGTHTFECDDCDHSYNENCSYTSSVTKQPSCTEPGIRTYTCSVCGYSYTESIPATGHSMKETVVPPTCTEQGYTLHECEHCDYSYKDGYVAATGHSYGDPIDNHNGTHSFECEHCDHSYSENCDFTSTITKEATCTENGVRTYTCTICGYSYTEVIPAPGHSMKETVVAPTDEKQGYTLHECEHCDYSYKDNYTDPLGHHFGTPTSNNDGTHTFKCEDCELSYNENCSFTSSVTKEPTCTENGERTYTCTACGYSYTETIPATGHSLKETIVAPTCEEQGYTLHECENCDYSYKDNYVEATGHSYGDPICNHDGTHSYECENCEHSYIEQCNFEVVITKEPTCTENGSKTYTCTICGYSYTEVIPATGHKMVDTVVPPTCTEQGYTIHECEECGYSYIDSYVSPTGHHYEDPTPNNDSTHTCHCKDCEDSYIENCDFLVEITKEATESETGILTYTCKVCGYQYTEVIPKLEGKGCSGSVISTSIFVPVTAVIGVCLLKRKRDEQ